MLSVSDGCLKNGDHPDETVLQDFRAIDAALKAVSPHPNVHAHAVKV
jgi:hypothetical protein